MKTVNIHEAKTHLSRLIEDAVSGEDVVIAKAGKPMVRLVPVASLEGSRPLGMLMGQVRESEACWTPDPTLEDLFYGDDEVEEAGPGGGSSGPRDAARGGDPEPERGE
jgi:prevent-host-death family protein